MRDPFEIYTSLRKKGKNTELDWEESALDKQTGVEGFFDEQRDTPNLWWLKVSLLVIFAGLCFRLGHLQIIQGSNFRQLSDNNRIREQTLLAPRGLIKDRNGQTIAQNTASFNLVAIPFDLPKDTLGDEVHNLAQDFSLSEQDLTDKLKNVDRQSFEPVVLAQNLTQDQSILFATKSGDFYGFQIQQVPIRQYPDALAFAHVLGYTGLVSQSDLQHLDKSKYDANDFTGKLGVEASYENYLHGTNGQNLVEVDSSGGILDVLGTSDPVPGDVLVLNIDAGLQKELYHALTDNYPARKAAAVALDPRNGQVLALVSVPGFDNNQFAQGISQAQYQALLNDKSLPLFDRAIAGTYPPGSTVKPMVATAALQTGVINEHTVVNDNGVLYIPNQFDPSVKYAFRGWKPGGLGAMNVRSAIALSSDIFFYTVAGGYPGSQVPQGLGAQALADFYRKFNLGNLTGIDLGGEKPGLVPDPEWKANFYKGNAILSQWYLGDTYHLGIGQGDLLVTPLQDAEWTAIIANNGVGYKPQIAQKVLDNNGKVVWQSKPEVLVSNIASPENFKIVQEGMRQTVLTGTAKPLNTLPITSAGKTGTSQFDGSDPTRTHAWFTAYAPYENPQIVITVLVEAGGEGNEAAEPVVKTALQWWAENRYQK